MGRNPPAEDRPTVTYGSGRTSQDGFAFSATAAPPDLRLVHYNDVYHLDPSSAEPKGGIARFMAAMKQYRSDDRFQGQPELLTFFSGDAFNPSLESAVTKGEHMVPVLNGIGTDCACVGNHDFDFGVRQFETLTAKCDFPWLLANVLDPALGDDVPLGNAKRTHMMTSSNGIKIGLIGLGEREWLETINSLPPNLIYKSASQTAKELVPELRAQGAEMIICLSHQREPNDNKLAEKTDGLMDIILGGHDHFYAHSLIRGTHVLRSGTDFKQLSYIEARRKPGGSRWDFDILRRDIVSSIPEDPAALRMAEDLTSKLKHKLCKPIGWTATPLDARFSTVRMRESNIGNIVCDIMRHYHDADAAIMAAGTIRGDQIYPPGVVRVRDITNCFPFEDPVVFIRVTGRQLWDALENGVSAYPALEGRFPQVSNIEFEFDASRAPGSRLNFASVGGEPVDMERKYTLATRGYMARGKDGFDSLLVRSEGGEAEDIVDEENGILISTMLRQYFMGLRTVGQWRNLSEHWVKVADSATTPATERKPRAPWDGSDEVDDKGALGGGYDTRTDRVVESPSWRSWMHKRLGVGVNPADEDESDTDVDVKEEIRAVHDMEARDMAAIDLELLLMRKFFGRWAKKAGIMSREVDPLQEGDFAVDWTRVIAPVLEGRIKMVGDPAQGLETRAIDA